MEEKKKCENEEDGKMKDNIKNHSWISTVTQWKRKNVKNEIE